LCVAADCEALENSVPAQAAAQTDAVQERQGVLFLLLSLVTFLTPRNLWSRYSSNGVWLEVRIYELDKMVKGEITWNNRSLWESAM